MRRTCSSGSGIIASLLVVITAQYGCTGTLVIPGDNGGGGEDDDSGATTNLRVSFEAEGGNYAVGQDDHGNEYTFRAREGDSGAIEIAEANIQTTDGVKLTVSLDGEGRPVNFRASDNMAADLVYSSDSVMIRLTNAEGDLVSEGRNIDPDAAHDRVTARQAEARDKAAVRAQNGDVTAIVTLTAGLATYELVVESVFDARANPNSPLARSSFELGARLLGRVASQLRIDVVASAEIFEVTLDEVPAVVRALAGRTFVLFDAEGFCTEVTDVASRLNFDADGILQSEFDRHLVFPDFSLGGRGEPGITINYSTGTPVNLTPDAEVGFELFVTPVFTSTQVDDYGNITIERRFQTDLGFDVDVFGPAHATANGLFDVAFINGELYPGGVLEFDLLLIDLQTEATLQHGRLRYHDQNIAAPPRVFGCDVITGDRVESEIVCPGRVDEGEDFEVQFILGHIDQVRGMRYDWFISDGFGVFLGSSFDQSVLVRATAGGFLEVTLVVSDLLGTSDTFEVYSCGVSVGRPVEIPPLETDLFLECPIGLNVGEPGEFAVFGSNIAGLEFTNWFVFGTSAYYISDPFSLGTDVEIYEPGRYEVAIQAFDIRGEEVFASCEVLVGGFEFDECDANGYYHDGVCDAFCPQPDPDCDVFVDICELNDYYGDGVCDDFCPELDPDCEEAELDICAENAFYGDGECDLFCPLPDPDCDVEVFDFCAENDYYGDGECDDFCPQPDPDCGGGDEDVCEVNGYYGDGECDEFCFLPDPDCDVEVDICEVNNYYGDGECDEFCILRDPDCI